MDRRTFIKGGTMVAAATTLIGWRSRVDSSAAAVTHSTATKTLEVRIHGGFAHIFQRRNASAQSLLFGPARASHGHPHGIRLRVRKSDIQMPSGSVPFGEVTFGSTDFLVWDLLGWEVDLLPDNSIPSGMMALPTNGATTNPTPSAQWDSLEHIPDLSARGAGSLRKDYRARMSSSVLLHAGKITVEPPSDLCAQYSMLRFETTDYAVSDRLKYDINFNDHVVLGVSGPGLSNAKEVLRPTGNSLNLIVDFAPIPTARYSDGDLLLHYRDLNGLGQANSMTVPMYVQANECLCECGASPGYFCPPGRYTQDL